jgi:hypothetical protein
MKVRNIKDSGIRDSQKDREEASEERRIMRLNRKTKLRGIM